MTREQVKLSHKIKLIFCRINWWFKLTENAKKYADKVKEYETIEKLIRKKQFDFIKAEKQNDKKLQGQLLIEMKVLGELIE